MSDQNSINWIKATDQLPNQGDECILLSKDIDAVLGPIAWNEGMGGWFDFFATPEAAHIYKPEHIGYWTLADVERLEEVEAGPDAL